MAEVVVCDPGQVSGGNATIEQLAERVRAQRAAGGVYKHRTPARHPTTVRTVRAILHPSIYP